MRRSSLSRSCRWLAWGLGSLGLWFALALPVSALPCLAETAERPCYRPPARRSAVLVQLARTADRVTVLLHTAVTPALAGGHSRVPLFHVPPAYRPPHLLHRELDVRAVLENGIPDPAYPHRFRLAFVVTPEGGLSYDPSGIPRGIRYLAYTGTLTWGTTLPANDRIVLEILDDRWLRPVPYGFGYSPRPVAQRATWDGTGRVSALQLNIAGLDGVPPVVFELTRLRTLNLEDNRLSILPPEIGQLTQLQTLQVNIAGLTTLPPEIGQLTQLHRLELFRNRLTALPPEIGQLTQLQTLYLFDNELTTLPPALGQLTQLHTLGLGRNRLTALPPEIGQLTNLQVLSLEDNRLTTLPPEIGQLTQLRQLTLQRNALTAIPPVLGELINLTILRLGFNQLAGPIPPTLGQLTQLESLDLKGRKWGTAGPSQHVLTGGIPPALGQLTQLVWLDLAGNELTGGIPPALGQLAALEYLFLRHNRLTGPIPPALGQLTRLKILDLADNALTGPVPPELGYLTPPPTGTDVRLDGNLLTGCLPAAWQRWPHYFTVVVRGDGEDRALPFCPD